MTAPARIQLSRRKGFNLQEASLALNGLPAIVVARPTKWGNPYAVHAMDLFGQGWITPERAVELFRRGCEKGFLTIPYTRLTAEERGDGLESFGAHAIAEVAPKYLAGHNLACWCPLDGPCHADVLLEIANGPAPETGRPAGARPGRGCANTPGHPFEGGEGQA